MPTTNGRPMKAGEKTRLHQAIYVKNSGPDVLTTQAILAGCEQADSLLSAEFISMAKASTFYLTIQQTR